MCPHRLAVGPFLRYPLVPPMRLLLTVVLAALCAIPVSAQTIYQPDGARGFGLFASYVPVEGGRTLGAGAVVSVLPGVDLAVDYARATNESNSRAVTAVGGSVAFYLVRTRGTRVGLSLGAVRVSDDDDSGMVGSGALVVGHQAALAPGVEFVPQVTFGVPFALGEHGGAGFSGAVTPAFVVGSGEARFAVAPSVSYGFDSRETSVAVSAGLITSL